MKQNVRRVVRKLREASDLLLIEPQRAGKLKVVGLITSSTVGR